MIDRYRIQVNYTQANEPCVFTTFTMTNSPELAVESAVAEASYLPNVTGISAHKSPVGEV